MVETGATAPKASPLASETKILSFALDNENLRVDKVGMKDGQLRPDGNLDHAFDATIEGPFDALFVVETNAKGEPSYGYRADTLIHNEELPGELAAVIDTGTMTPGIAVSESGKFVNADNGSASLPVGTHVLRLYGPNTNTLAAGDFVRLYARTPGGGLVAGPIASY